MVISMDSVNKKRLNIYKQKDIGREHRFSERTICCHLHKDPELTHNDNALKIVVSAIMKESASSGITYVIGHLRFCEVHVTKIHV